MNIVLSETFLLSLLKQFLALEEENNQRRERIKQKDEMLREMVMQHVAFKALVERNKRAESQGVVPSPNSSIQLPFIIVNTHKSTKINCSVTNDKYVYFNESICLTNELTQFLTLSLSQDRNTYLSSTTHSKCTMISRS